MDNLYLIGIIKKMCKEKEITIKKCLQDCNINRNFIYDTKNGKKPSVEILEKLSDYFNCSTDYLLGRSNEKSTKNLSANKISCSFPSDEQQKKLLCNYNKLNPTAQKTLLDYSDFMTTKPENLKEISNTNQMIS